MDYGLAFTKHNELIIIEEYSKKSSSKKLESKKLKHVTWTFWYSIVDDENEQKSNNKS